MSRKVTDLQPWECLMKRIVWKQLGDVHDKKSWADHNYHEDGGESIAMVQKRNMEALNKILSDNQDKEIVIGTHGTALSTILNIYDNSFDCEDFFRIIDWMPYIIEFNFEKCICVDFCAA